MGYESEHLLKILHEHIHRKIGYRSGKRNNWILF